MRNMVLGLGLALVAAGCARPAALSVEDAWVRLPAVPGNPAAAYFTIRGGASDATLIAVRAVAASRGEMHEAGMRAVGAVNIPADGEVRFAPGGRHVMLYDPDPRLAPGKRMVLHLVFADGRTLSVEAKAVGPADPAP